MVARDPHGFRPLCIGRVDGRYVVASETCRFRPDQREYVRDVEPGEVIVIDDDLLESSFRSRGRSRRTVSLSTSISAGPTASFSAAPWIPAGASSASIWLGIPVDADVVVPVPDSRRFRRNRLRPGKRYSARVRADPEHYVGRTFIEPKQSIRNFGVKVKLTRYGNPGWPPRDSCR